MKLIADKFLYWFLIVECIVFSLFYVFGPKGKTALWQTEKVKVQVVSEIRQLEQDIVQLQKMIEGLEVPFAKEKIARERLLMKKAGEQIYIKKM